MLNRFSSAIISYSVLSLDFVFSLVSSSCQLCCGSVFIVRSRLHPDVLSYLFRRSSSSPFYSFLYRYPPASAAATTSTINLSASAILSRFFRWPFFFLIYIQRPPSHSAHQFGIQY